MTIGSWEPNAAPTTIPIAAVEAAIGLMQYADFPSDAPAAVTPLKAFAKSSAEVWQETFATLSSEELKILARFFTLAEATWADWFGGDKNPVIWICKALKKRGDFPDKDLTMWIKQNTDNRFLPYGNALG